VDAAVEAVRRKGYNAATVDDIAAEAGAGRATFYLHFGSKLDCMQAVFYERLMPDLGIALGALDEVLEHGSADRMREWVAYMLAWCADHRTLLLILEQLWINEGERAQSMQPGFAEYLPRLVARSGDNHQEAVLRIWLLAQLLGRAYMMLRVNRRLAEGEVDDDLLTEILADIFVRTLRLDEETGKSSP